MNTMNSLRTPFARALVGLLLACVLVSSSGCFLLAIGAAGAAGAGTVAYISGELTTTLSGRLDSVSAAAGRATIQLQLAKISDKKDAFSAVIIARTAQDEKVTIKIEKEGDELCRVKIRVGVFGDEAKSRAILEKIRSDL